MNPLRQWRRKQRYSALDIALQLEVTERTVQAWERGAFKPSSEAYVSLSKLMNLTELELRTAWLNWLLEMRDARDTARRPSNPFPPSLGLREPV